MNAADQARSSEEIAALRALLVSGAARAALVIGHPAHEIRIYEWMRRARPFTYVLTTGSRNGEDRARIEACARTVARAGGVLMNDWGQTLDRALYAHLLNSAHGWFENAVAALSADFVAREIELVVADGWQLYNVAHDLAHVLARCAAARAGRVMGRDIPVLDYPVVPMGVVPLAAQGAHVLTLTLDDAALTEKKAAVALIPDVAPDVLQLEIVEGPETFRTEALHLPLPLETLRAQLQTPPHYEHFGAFRVKLGQYTDVVRGAHMRSALDALTGAADDAWSRAA